jgi:hypothetical protein
MSGTYIKPLNNNSLNLSGGTVSGQTTFTGGLSATNFSAGTINSGSTNLYDIFITQLDGNDITRVQPGLNTYTGGTGNAPTVNVSALTINTLSVSGNTNLQAVTATTLSTDTINSGSTNIYNIFQPLGENSVLSNGLNTYTGGSFFNQTINVSALTINTLSVSGSTILATLTATTITATTISATTITSPIIYGSGAFSGILRIDSTSDNIKGPIIFGTAGKTNVYNFNVGSATTVFTIRERIGATSQGALYLGVAPGSETNTNYTIGYDGTLRINTQSSTASLSLLAGNTGLLVIVPGNSIGNPFYDFQARARTSLTTTSNIPVFNINPSIQTWATGTVPLQYFNYFRSQTMGFAGGSTAGLVASMAVGHTAVGSNATFGTGVGIYVLSGTYSSTTTAYGILIDTVTGATTNFGLGVVGDVFITGNTITNSLSAATITATTLTAGTIHVGNFSAHTNSVSGVSVFHTSGGTPVWSVNTTNGRVGILNASPGHTLDVGGNINARNSIGQVGGYYINGNTVLQQGPTGYGNSMFLFGGNTTTTYNIFPGVPFGIAVSGNSLVLRNAFTVGQQLNGYGSIQTLTGAIIITGVGTNFLTTFNVGDTIRFASNNYIISAITTDTSLTLTTTASTTSSSSTYFVPGGGERFYIAGNGNVRTQSNSISGFTVVNQTGGTPVFNVDTKNLITSANNFSGGTVSGGTLYSGSTNLYDIFKQTDTFVINETLSQVGLASGNTYYWSHLFSTSTGAPRTTVNQSLVSLPYDCTLIGASLTTWGASASQTHVSGMTLYLRANGVDYLIYSGISRNGSSASSSHFNVTGLDTSLSANTTYEMKLLSFATGGAIANFSLGVELYFAKP